MTKETIYIDLTKCTSDQLKNIVEECSKQGLNIISQYKNLFNEGLFNEKMPFLFFSTTFRLFTCTFIRHQSKKEVDFKDFTDIINNNSENEINQAKNAKIEVLYISDYLQNSSLSKEKKIELLKSLQDTVENS